MDVAEYFSEPINYGGAICTRGEAIRDMEAMDLSQREIDRWLQGNALAAERGLGIQPVAPGDYEGEVWEPVGVTETVASGFARSKRDPYDAAHGLDR